MPFGASNQPLINLQNQNISISPTWNEMLIDALFVSNLYANENKVPGMEKNDKNARIVVIDCDIAVCRLFV